MNLNQFGGRRGDDNRFGEGFGFRCWSIDDKKILVPETCGDLTQQPENIKLRLTILQLLVDTENIWFLLTLSGHMRTSSATLDSVKRGNATFPYRYTFTKSLNFKTPSNP
jgi:hypothetical protein